MCYVKVLALNSYSHLLPQANHALLFNPDRLERYLLAREVRKL